MTTGKAIGTLLIATGMAFNSLSYNITTYMSTSMEDYFGPSLVIGMINDS